MLCNERRRLISGDTACPGQGQGNSGRNADEAIRRNATEPSVSRYIKFSFGVHVVLSIPSLSM
jgi:hypothetical protein